MSTLCTSSGCNYAKCCVSKTCGNSKIGTFYTSEAYQSTGVACSSDKIQQDAVSCSSINGGHCDEGTCCVERTCKNAGKLGNYGKKSEVDASGMQNFECPNGQIIPPETENTACGGSSCSIAICCRDRTCGNSDKTDLYNI